MLTYAIESDDRGGFHVRAAETPEEKSHIVMSFETWQKAREWIDDQTQIAMKSANASDVA